MADARVGVWRRGDGRALVIFNLIYTLFVSLLFLSFPVILTGAYWWWWWWWEGRETKISVTYGYAVAVMIIISFVSRNTSENSTVKNDFSVSVGAANETQIP